MIIIKKLLKTIIALSVCVAVNFSSGHVYADNEKNITILGDSISTGFGLEENEINYVGYLEEYFQCDAINYAVNGQTTEDLLSSIENYDVSSDIENSDYICISTGGNDLLSIFTNVMYGQDVDFSFVEGTLNIDGESIDEFIADYSDEFENASVSASENIISITKKIKAINPEAEIIMLTIYNPLELSGAEASDMILPLKEFTAVYLDSINSTIKNSADYTADINLKFSEKPYLYTNIEEFDIHPNSLGHMLIAEEIIQTIGENGEHNVFSDAIYNIPQGTYSKLPIYISDELSLLAEGTLRNISLEQAIAQSAVPEENITETDILEDNGTEIISEATEDTELQSEEENKSNSFKNKLSKIFMILGVSLILAVSMRKFIRKKQNNL